MITRFGNIEENELKLEELPRSPTQKLKNYAFRLLDEQIDFPVSSLILVYDDYSIKLNDAFMKKEKVKWPLYFTSRSSYHKVRLPRFIDPKLAYFMGYFYADGSLKDIMKSKFKRNKFEHKIKVGDEFLLQVKFLQKLFKEIFNLDTPIRDERIKKGEIYYYIEINDKVVYRFFIKLFGLPAGPKTGKLNFPTIIQDCPKDIRKWFIRGVFDADGQTRATEYYREGKIKPRIRLHIKDYKFIVQIKDYILRDFEIKFNGPYLDKNEKASCIQIEKMEDIRKAQSQKLFIHPIKKWRLASLINFYNQIGFDDKLK